jgi:hypothetical protein
MYTDFFLRVTSLFKLFVKTLNRIVIPIVCLCVCVSVCIHTNVCACTEGLEDMIASSPIVTGKFYLMADANSALGSSL